MKTIMIAWISTWVFDLGSHVMIAENLWLQRLRAFTDGNEMGVLYEILRSSGCKNASIYSCRFVRVGLFLSL